MNVYVISYPTFFNGEAESIGSLMGAFDFTFHLRKPYAGDSQYKQLLCDIPLEFHHRIVLHGAYGLQNKYNVKGLHISTTTREAGIVPETNGTKSSSCHALAEAGSLDGQFDYMFMSPVFESISKPGYTGNLDMNAVKNYLNTSRQSKMIALGGIDAETLPKLKGFNFDGIALLGAVWTNKPSADIDFVDNLKTIYQCL